MKKTTLALFLVLVVSCGVSAIYLFTSRRPIELNELIVGSVQRQHGNAMYTYVCVNPTMELLSRCQRVGGAIQENTTHVGLGAEGILGCYPKERTTDEGRKCMWNIQCQGQCIWLNGDLSTGSESRTCSVYKKPYFIFSNMRLPNGAQGLCEDIRQ